MLTTAFSAAVLNASTVQAFLIVASWIVPSFATQNVTTTRPRLVMSAYGIAHCLFRVAMKRRIQGPNSTPFVSSVAPTPVCGEGPAVSAGPSIRAAHPRPASPDPARDATGVARGDRRPARERSRSSRASSIRRLMKR